jgi:hypothetical protein
MRFSRILGIFALVAALAIGAVWRVSASQGSPRPRAAAATTRAKLQRELQRFPQRGPALPLLPAGSGTCFVAGGSCSLKPCVLPIQRPARLSVAATTSNAVALASPTPAAPDQIPASACHGRIGTPQTFRVGARPG